MKRLDYSLVITEVLESPLVLLSPIPILVPYCIYGFHWNGATRTELEEVLDLLSESHFLTFFMLHYSMGDLIILNPKWNTVGNGSLG